MIGSSGSARQGGSSRRRRWSRRLFVAGLLLALGAWVGMRLATQRVEAELVRLLSAQLDADVELGETELGLRPPRLVLSGLRASRDGSTIASAERLSVTLDGSALLRRRVLVRLATVESASLRLGDGGWDPAAGAGSGDSSATVPFEVVRLRVSDASLTWVRGEDVLALKGLSLRADRLYRSGSGGLELAGRLGLVQDAAPVLNEAELKAVLKLDEVEGLAIEATLEELGRLDLQASAQLRDFASAETLSWDASLQGGLELAPFAALSPFPPDSRLDGTLSLEAEARGLGRDWSGTLSAGGPGLRLEETGGPGLEVEELETALAFSPTALEITQLRARLAGGRLRLTGRLPWASPVPVLELQSELDDLRLAELPRVAALTADADLRGLLLRGRFDLQVPLGELSATTGHAELNLSRPRTAELSPVRVELSADGGAAGLSFHRAELELPSLSVSAGGTLGWDGSGRLTVKALVPSLEAAGRAWEQQLPALASQSLEGSLSFEGEVRGTPAKPLLSGRLSLAGLARDGVRLGKLAAAVQADRERLLVTKGSLRGSDLDLAFHGRLPWASPTASEIDVELERVDAASLAKLAALDLSVSGGLTGRALLRPGSDGPELLSTIEMSEGEFEGRPLRDLRLDFRADQLGVDLREAVVALAGGRVEAEGGLSFVGAGRDLLIRAADIDLVELALTEELSRGRASAELVLGGPVSALRPTGPARWVVEDLAIAERSFGRLEGELALIEGGFGIQLSGLEGALRGEGTIGSTAEAPVEARLELDSFALDSDSKLVEGLDLETEGLALTLSGSLAAPSELEHALTIARLEAKWKGLDIQAPHGLAVSGSGARLRIVEQEVQVGKHSTRVDGELSLLSPHEHDLHLRGGVELADLEAWFPGLKAQGVAAFVLKSRSDGGAPELAGDLRVSKAQLRVPGLPQAIEDLELVARLSGERLELESANATLGGGRITAEGGLSLEGLKVTRHRLAIQGEDVRLRLAEGLRGSSSFSLALEGDPDASLLSGTIDLHEARYTRDVKLEAALASRGRAPPRPSAPGPLDKVRLELRVRADSGLVVDNDLASIELAADLEVVGSASRPTLVGSARALTEGRLTFQRARYRLTTGELAFTLTHPNDPALDVFAVTRLADHDIELKLAGRVSDPRVELSSSPPLPPERIVALLATGGAFGAGSGDVVPAELAGEFLLGRMGSVNAKLKEATGLDVFAIDPVLGAGQGDHVARLTVGKKLGERTTAIVSTDLGGDSVSSLSLTTNLSPKIALRAAREATGSNAVGIAWTRPPKHPAPPPSAAEKAEFVRGELELGGLPPELEASELVEAMLLPPGAPLSERELRRASGRLRDALQERDHALARVRCELLEPAEAQEGPSRDLSCRVEAGPVVVLELEGDLDKKLRRRLREEIVQEWRELFRASDLAAEAVRAAELVFARKGRLTPELSVSEEAGSEQHLVRMKVSPGPRARVGGFEFPGATSIGEDELRAAALSAAEPALLRPLLTPSLLEGAATAVEALYRSRGWLDARVGAATWEVVDGGERATVSLPVSEGARLLLGDVRFRGNRLWPASELSERLALATGGHLEPQELDRATRALIGYYDAEGHAEVAVIWSLARQDDAATVTFEIEEGRQYRVGTVSVLGAQRTRESLIRKVARIETGQPFSRDALTEASRRLLASGLFQRASARGAPESSLEGTRAVFVQVLERDPVSLSAGLGFDDQEGLSGSFTAVHSNLRGRGTSLASRLRLGGSESEGELALRLPRLGARKTDFLATLGLRRESRPSLTVERLGLALEATRPRSWPGRVQSSFRAEEVRLDDIETSDFDQSLDEGFFAELGVSLVRDTRDSTLTPKRGSLSTLRLSLGAGLNATTSLFPRLFARHARFHELRPGLIHSMGLRLGVGSALEGPRLPLAERYRAGGITTLRGFARDRVGPLDPLTGEALGGDALLILNQELSLQVSSRVSVHAFVDAGHVYDEVGELWDLDLRLSAGLGVGTNTPIGPFRLYHAWVLDRRDDERRSRFHFAFTSTF